MRCKCLVMDHDDTTVNSTATIHFPSFCAYLQLVRPQAHYTLEEYFRKNFDPGILPLFTGELGFTDEELEAATAQMTELMNLDNDDDDQEDGLFTPGGAATLPVDQMLGGRPGENGGFGGASGFGMYANF